MNRKAILLKLSGICGISLLLVFLVGLFFSIRQAPWFNWTDYAISDLGTSIPLFNYTLLTVGIILLIFTFGLYFSLHGERAGPVVFALSSIYFIAVGLFPLPSPIHVETSGLFFIAFPLGFFILGIQLHRESNVFLRKMGHAALILPLISACSPSFLLFFRDIAVPEMTILVPGFLWCMRYGIHLVQHQKNISSNQALL
jgi:hypothetical membrane protein